MLDPDYISRLFTNVLDNDIVVNKISSQSIREGIRCMGKAYSAECANFNSNIRDFPDYNHPAFRCAYLHKYAPLHTYIVFDVMQEILKQKKHVFQQLVRSGDFKFCCLGGGPGNDVIAILAALFSAFNFFRASATVIDLKKDWEFTFKSVVDELKYGEYGEIWRTLAENLNWSYIGANLLDTMTNEVSKSIGSASFVTMMKFVSAASCTSVERMLEKIFRVIKPGALVLFIDNAAGGFTQVVERVSKKNSFEAVIPTRRHVCYENDVFKTERFGVTSCSKSTVTIIFLRKSLNLNQRPESLQNGNINFTPFLHYSVPTVSHKSSIKEENLNFLHQEKNLTIQKKKVATTPQSKSPIKSKNSSSRQNDYRLINSGSVPSSPQSNLSTYNLNSVTRKTDFKVVNNRITNSRSVPSSSSGASRRSAVGLQYNSTSNYRSSSARERHGSQQTSDVDDTCCLCCVIS